MIITKTITIGAYKGSKTNHQLQVITSASLSPMNIKPSNPKNPTFINSPQ